jgi:glucose-6-phosphate isomerase
MSARAGELCLDFSHNLLDDAVLDELLAGVSTAGLPAAIHAAFGPPSTDAETQQLIRALADRVRLGSRRGSTGARIRHVVDLDVDGGLGPRMVLRALRDCAGGGPDVRFVADADGIGLATALQGLDPAATLFVVRSTTSTGSATRSASESARTWLLAALGHNAAVREHFVVVADDASALRWLDTDERDRFDVRRAVGERSWLTSSAGLSILLALGAEHYDDLLAGLSDMDQHLRTTPWRDNLPVLMGLVALWNRHGLELPPPAVLPCTEDLELLPAYVQQRQPEGSSGCAATTVTPCDIIAVTTPIGRSRAQHDQLLACSLQTSPSGSAAERTGLAVMGAVRDRVPHRAVADDRPSNTLLAPALTPRVLGQLLAAYEHKHFVQQVLVAPDARPGPSEGGLAGPYAEVH